MPKKKKKRENKEKKLGSIVKNIDWSKKCIFDLDMPMNLLSIDTIDII